MFFISQTVIGAAPLLPRDIITRNIQDLGDVMQNIQEIVADAVPVSISMKRYGEFTARLTGAKACASPFRETLMKEIEDSHAGVRKGQIEWNRNVIERLNAHKETGIKRMNDALTRFSRSPERGMPGKFKELQQLLQLIYNETVGFMMDEQLSGYVEGITPPEDDFKLPPVNDNDSDYDVEERFSILKFLWSILREKFLGRPPKVRKSTKLRISFRRACSESYDLNNIAEIVQYLKTSYRLTADNFKKVLNLMQPNGYHHEIDIIDKALIRAEYATNTADRDFCVLSLKKDQFSEPDDDDGYSYLDASYHCFQRFYRIMSDIRSTFMAEMNVVCAMHY